MKQLLIYSYGFPKYYSFHALGAILMALLTSHTIFQRTLNII